MVKIELAIDFGSKQIKIAKKDGGLILKEAAVVALMSVNGKTKLVKAGNEAVALMNKGDRNLIFAAPIFEGVVKQEYYCELMLKSFISRIAPKTLIPPQIKAIVCVSCGLTNTEKSAVEKVCLKAGIQDVTLIESPLALMPRIRENCAFTVDIGGDKTDIAILGEHGIISGCSINVGGNHINQAIHDYLCDKHKVRVIPQLVEKVKTNVGSMYDNDLSCVEVNGMSIIDGSSRRIKLTAEELLPIIKSVIDKIVKVVESVTMMIPESIAENIYASGFYISGGVAALPGLDRYMEDKLCFRCNKIDGGEDAVALGALEFFYNKEWLNHLLNITNLD